MEVIRSNSNIEGNHRSATETMHFDVLHSRFRFRFYLTRKRV